MKKLHIISAIIAMTLFASAAVASPPWANNGGDTFSMSGDGGAQGSTSSFSGTAGLSVTGVLGNGGAEQSSFSGAAQADRAGFETSFTDGRIQIDTDTLSQGETFASSDGWTYGAALGATGAFADRSGFADASSGFGLDFEFGTGNGWTPPGQDN